MGEQVETNGDGEHEVREERGAAMVAAPVLAQMLGPNTILALVIVVLLVFAGLFFVYRRMQADRQLEEEEHPELEEGERPTEDLLEEREEVDEPVEDYEDMSLAEVKKAKMARVSSKKERAKAGEATEQAKKEHVEVDDEDDEEREAEAADEETPSETEADTSEEETDEKREGEDDEKGEDEEEGERRKREEPPPGIDEAAADEAVGEIEERDDETADKEALDDEGGGTSVPSPTQLAGEEDGAGDEDEEAGTLGEESSIPAPTDLKEDALGDEEDEERDAEASEQAEEVEASGDRESETDEKKSEGDEASDEEAGGGEERAAEETTDGEDEAGEQDETPEDEATSASSELETEAEPKSLEEGLEKTREGLFDQLNSFFTGEKLSPEMVEEVEQVLFQADIGPRVAQDIIDAIEERLSGEELEQPGKVWSFIRHYSEELLSTHEEPLDPTTDEPFVILVVGVNGVGKTTTIGKMASRFKQAGLSSLLVAGDTFRAGAVDQLGIWAERTGLPMHEGEEGADPASVVYEGIERARDEEIDIVLCDTSGRLHTDVNLMEELEKMERVAGKAKEGAPHEVHLVLDANTGQNAIQQAEKFSESLDVSGMTLTKFDGTARGGVILGICKRFEAPVRYVGIGERVVDLREFRADEFVEALFM